MIFYCYGMLVFMHTDIDMSTISTDSKLTQNCTATLAILQILKS